MNNNKITILNKKASYNYELIESFIAGISLKGTEIKSIKESKLSLLMPIRTFLQFDNFPKFLACSFGRIGT